MEHGDSAPDVTNGSPADAQDAAGLPKAPNPSADPGVIPPIVPPSFDSVQSIKPCEDLDVATLEPLAALKLLAKGVQGLVDMTGEVPPTPPISRRSSSTKLGRVDRILAEEASPSVRPITPPSNVPPDDIKSPSFQTVQIGSPEAHLHEPTPLEADTRVQYDAIARKFFSKQPPPISIDDYLLRLHRYCPMSTAVYLAAGVYVRKVAVEEQAVPVTTRTVHRLLLASLRVAMKALEDLSYPHQRFAGVGGVSEKELAKLEINMCYLTNFELRVTMPILDDCTRALQQLSKSSGKPSAGFTLALPSRARRGTVA